MSRFKRWSLMPPPGKHRGLRVLLLIVLVLVLFWAYSEHFDRRLEEINSTRTIFDQAKKLSSAEKRQLKKLIGAYKQEYGIKVRLEVRSSPMQELVLTNQTLFVSLGPDVGQYVFVLPSLARKALPDDAEAMYAEQLKTCASIAPPGACFERLLQAVYADLQK